MSYYIQNLSNDLVEYGLNDESFVVSKDSLPFYLQAMDMINGVKIFINQKQKLNRGGNWILEMGFEFFTETYTKKDFFLRLDLLFYGIDKILNFGLEKETISISVLAENANACNAQQL